MRTRQCGKGLTALVGATLISFSLLTFLPVAQAGDFQSLVQEYEKIKTTYVEAYRAAQTQAERERIVAANLPKLQTYNRRFLELAQKNPQDPSAIDPLIWIVLNQPQSAECNTAVDLLQKNHVTSAQLAPVCVALANTQSKMAETFLRTVLEKNPDHTVQGVACYCLACFLRNQSPDAALLLFERVMTQYGGIQYNDLKLREAAQQQAIQLPLAKTDQLTPTATVNNSPPVAKATPRSNTVDKAGLPIGSVAPEIVGQDQNGVMFKLSDYRGKIVVLDFWGDW